MRGRPEPQAIDDMSGFKVPASSLVRQWDGMMTQPRFCEKRNPQDFVTGVRDNQTLRVARPEAPDVFLTSPVTPDDL